MWNCSSLLSYGAGAVIFRDLYERSRLLCYAMLCYGVLCYAMLRWKRGRGKEGEERRVKRRERVRKISILRFDVWYCRLCDALHCSYLNLCLLNRWYDAWQIWCVCAILYSTAVYTQITKAKIRGNRMWKYILWHIGCRIIMHCNILFVMYHVLCIIYYVLFIIN